MKKGRWELLRWVVSRGYRGAVEFYHQYHSIFLFSSIWQLSCNFGIPKPTTRYGNLQFLLCMFEAAYKKHYKIIDYWDYLLSLQGII